MAPCNPHPSRPSRTATGDLLVELLDQTPTFGSTEFDPFLTSYPLVSSIVRDFIAADQLVIDPGQGDARISEVGPLPERPYAELQGQSQ